MPFIELILPPQSGFHTCCFSPFLFFSAKKQRKWGHPADDVDRLYTCHDCSRELFVSYLLNRHWGIISAYGRCVVSCSIQIVWGVSVEDYAVRKIGWNCSDVCGLPGFVFFKKRFGLENRLVCCQLWGLGSSISGVFHETKKQNKQKKKTGDGESSWQSSASRELKS